MSLFSGPFSWVIAHRLHIKEIHLFRVTAWFFIKNKLPVLRKDIWVSRVPLMTVFSASLFRTVYPFLSPCAQGPKRTMWMTVLGKGGHGRGAQDSIPKTSRWKNEEKGRKQRVTGLLSEHFQHQSQNKYLREQAWLLEYNLFAFQPQTHQQQWGQWQAPLGCTRSLWSLVGEDGWRPISPGPCANIRHCPVTRKLPVQLPPDSDGELQLCFLAVSQV